MCETIILHASGMFCALYCYLLAPVGKTVLDRMMFDEHGFSSDEKSCEDMVNLSLVLYQHM